MGRIRNFLGKFSRKEELKTIPDEILLTPELEVNLNLNSKPWEMPKNPSRTQEQLIEDSKLLIKLLDSRIDFVLHLIDDLNQPEIPSHEIFANELYFMKLWYAHVAYKTKIEDFLELIKDPTILSPSIKTKTNKKIKCITDLPLQKKILN
jgi:hypothetical protein